MKLLTIIIIALLFTSCIEDTIKVRDSTLTPLVFEVIRDLDHQGVYLDISDMGIVFTKDSEVKGRMRTRAGHQTLQVNRDFYDRNIDTNRDEIKLTILHELAHSLGFDHISRDEHNIHFLLEKRSNIDNKFGYNLDFYYGQFLSLLR
jgi:hypothetical protein